MDEIQRTLIKAGRKDLAQKYYEKTSAFGINHQDSQFVEDILKKLNNTSKGETERLEKKEIKKINDSLRKIMNESKTIMHYLDEIKKRGK